MIYNPHTILEEIKTFCMLEDGDIIMCGTPKGVGNYNVSDVFEIKLYVDEKLMLEKKWEVIKKNRIRKRLRRIFLQSSCR